jgi:hypothetical protein
VQAPGAVFLQEAREALIAEILLRGGTVARAPAGSVVINLDAEVVDWGFATARSDGTYAVAGGATGAGVLIGASGGIAPLGVAGIAAGSGLVAEALLALMPGTNAEVAWRATIVSDERIVLQIGEAMYVPESDIPLYQSSSKIQAIASLTPPAPLQVRQLRFAQ